MECIGIDELEAVEMFMPCETAIIARYMPQA
jgi:hypothetical protein